MKNIIDDDGVDEDISWMKAKAIGSSGGEWRS